MIETTWDYSANTPEIDFLAEKMTENSIIDPALYGKYANAKKLTYEQRKQRVAEKKAALAQEE